MFLTLLAAGAANFVTCDTPSSQHTVCTIHHHEVHTFYGSTYEKHEHLKEPEQKFRSLVLPPHFEHRDPCSGYYWCPPLARSMGISDALNRRLWDRSRPTLHYDRRYGDWTTFCTGKDKKPTECVSSKPK
jgi:hypothetical protein